MQDFVNFKKEMAKESAGADVNEGKFVLNIDFIMDLKPDGLCVYETNKQDSISFQCIFNIDSLFYYIEFF